MRFLHGLKQAAGEASEAAVDAPSDHYSEE
jgi:hypothetical protein